MPLTHQEQQENRVMKVKTKQQKLRNKVYKVLLANQTSVWHHIVLSIIKHVEHEFQAIKKMENAQQQQIKSEIQNILRWISDPLNRTKLLQYKKQAQIWRREKQEWESTFERVLESGLQLKEKHEAELLEMQSRYKMIEQANIKLLGRNSVLQSALQLFIKKYEARTDKQTGSLEHPKVVDPQKIDIIHSVEHRLKINSYGCLVKIQAQDLMVRNNQEKCKNDAAVMTNEILLYGRQEQQAQQDEQQILTKNVELLSQEVQTEILSMAKITRKLKITKTDHIQLLKWTNESKQIQTQAEIQVSNECQTQYYNMRQQYQQNKFVQKRDTNVTQTNISNADDEIQSDSSESSYILQFDRHTQTQFIQTRNAQTQINFNQNQQHALTTLLLKISHLEQQIENKNMQIQHLSSEKSQWHHKTQIANRNITQLKNELQIANQIEQHANNQYALMKKQYGQLQQNYKDLLSSFNKFMQMTQQKLKKQDKQVQTQTFKEMFTPQAKQDQSDDQLLTNGESQEEEHGQSHSYVDKLTILRYLLQYVKLEVQAANPEKKVQTLLTVFEALGISPNSEELIKKYIQRMTSNFKYYQSQIPKQKIEQRLFKYLTDEG